MAGSSSTATSAPVTDSTVITGNGNGTEGGVKVKITVQKEQTVDVTFTVKRNVPLGKLMVEYCRKMGVSDREFRFTYLGKQVKDFHTPDVLGMEEEDVLDCWAAQYVGGAATV